MATGLRVEIVEELIAARIEGSDKNDDFLTWGHNLFAVKLVLSNSEVVGFSLRTTSLTLTPAGI